MTENTKFAWVLSIRHEKDDYKTRGESSKLEIYLFEEEYLCENKLRKIIIDKLCHIDNDYSYEDIKDINICYIDDDDEEDPTYFVEDSNGNLKYNDNLPLEALDIDSFHKFLAKGEYVNYEWIYKISKMEIKNEV